jgi:plastocyanin
VSESHRIEEETMRSVLLSLPVVGTAAVLLSGCGGGSGGGGYGVAATTAATTTTAAAAGAGGKTLSGSVGPGYDISMKETTVAPGTYTLNVDDQGTIHDFHFTGPGGVDVKTDVSGTGEKSFTVTLQKGTYTFVCDPHSSQMHVTLTVS